MSNVNPDLVAPAPADAQPADGFKPITSQDEFEARLGTRLARERGKFHDYDDLKAKAQRFDELEEQNKGEITKANDRVAAAEAEVAKLPTKVAETLRSHLIELHEISADDAELFLTATDPEVLTKQVSRLIGRAADALPGGNTVPSEGGNPTATPGDEHEAVKALFGGGG